MSEALRLAELLTNLKITVKGRDNAEAMEEAAAELRRLHAEHTELGQAIKRAIERNNELEAELHEQARVNGMGGEREARLMALNTELVEALKHAAECVQSNYLPDKCGHDWDDVIAKAEASK